MMNRQAGRMAQSMGSRMFHTTRSNRGIFEKRFVYRENRVPYYQRLYQRDDGKRLWWKTDRSPYLIYPYYVLLYGSLTAALYAMGRLVLGHKTWWY